MKAKKSIDRLLRDASEQPQALPPVDDCWQEFSILLDGETKRPKLVFGVHWLKGGNIKGGLGSLWLVLLGTGLAFSFWLMVENKQPTAHTNAVAQDETFAYTGKAQKPLSAPIAKDNATDGLSQSTETSGHTVVSSDTRQQTMNDASPYTHTPSGHLEAPNGQHKLPTTPAKAASLPRQTASWRAAALATAAQGITSSFLPVRDSSASIQDNLPQKDCAALADLPIKSTLCLLEPSPIPAPTHAAGPVIKTKPHWVRTGYIGWEPYLKELDYPTTAAYSLSLGASLQRPVKTNWGLRTELWWHRFGIPRLTLVGVQHLDVDGQRLTKYDSNLVHRVDRISINLLGTTKFRGLIISGGPALGYLAGAYQESFGRISSTSGGVTGSSYGLGYDPFPHILHRFSVGLKASAEYHFANRFLFGIGFYQGLNDATRTKQYNTFQNVYFYAGYKF